MTKAKFTRWEDYCATCEGDHSEAAMFNQSELSNIGLALKTLSETMVGQMDDDIMRFRREIWALREKVSSIYNRMPSSAEGQERP